jgi:hypothetical protein
LEKQRADAARAHRQRDGSLAAHVVEHDLVEERLARAAACVQKVRAHFRGYGLALRCRSACVARHWRWRMTNLGTGVVVAGRTHIAVWTEPIWCGLACVGRVVQPSRALLAAWRQAVEVVELVAGVAKKALVAVDCERGVCGYGKDGTWTMAALLQQGRYSGAAHARRS